MRQLRQILTILAATPLVLAAAAGAAPAGWERLHTTLFSNVGREAGLPHPIAMALAQDSDGFVWVGTQGGLTRYDGYRFRTFQHQDGIAGSLPGNVITALVPAAGGRLWVSTATGSIARYDPATGQFQEFPEPAGLPARGGVLSMVSDGGDGVWAGTNSGLEHVDAAGTVTREAHRAGDATSAPGDRVRALLRTSDGSLWVSTVTGLMRRDPGATAFTAVPLLDAHGQAVADEVIALTQDSAGRVWFATVRSGLGRVLPVSATTWEAARLVPEASPQALGGPMVFCLTEGRPGEIWVGRVAGGITIIDAATGALRTLRHNPLTPTSLGDDSVHALMRDRTGLLWAATNMGVSRTDLGTDAVDTLLPDSSAGGLPDANVLGITTTPDGRAWMGFKDHGAALLDPAAGMVTPLPNVASLPPGGVVSITAAPDGGVWLGAGTGRALFRHDPRTGRLEQHAFPGQVVGPVIYGLPEGNFLWFAAGPLVRYTPATGEATVLRHNPDDPASLVDDSVNVLLPDGAGGLWVGTRHGLDRMDGATGAFSHYLHDPADPHSLPADLITTLLVDRHGRLWLGTLGGGIGVLERPADPVHPGGVFRRLTMADGLPNDNIGTLLMDGGGRVWASTADGLAVIDPDTWATRALGRADGVAIPAYWIHSGAALPDGSLIFGGGGGATVVHPDRFKPKTERPPVVVTAVRVAGRAVPTGTMAAPAPIRLAPGDRSVEISFAALDYTAPEDVRYAYTLSGFDENWTEADATQRMAAYTNLPPGRYTLLIKAGDRAGDWSTPVKVSIKVQPAWWQTLWAKLAAVVLALAGVVALVQVRTAYLRRRRAALEEQVARQTRDLLAANERLKDLANRDPLTEIHNRRHFMELAEAALTLARPMGTPAALLMMDIDHFKQVNDTLGHSAGDEVLLAVVARIRALLRKTDVFARLGGEELALFMPDADETTALAVAERLRRAVGDTPYDIEGAGVVAVTVSIGVAAGPPTLPLKELLDRADHGLYAAKRAGRDRVAAGHAKNKGPDGNRQ
ncbi:ligand-binding sensor domain-containing diguanylate cyclase [Nitrospirillum viridazoti]|uniref:diguanylate cyclase n=1 Tax=Nitrospirillum viridazoti CBAmc TaxID=1441467 RepID=A0A248JR86_9PROT|nr:ligand-binding sensor domain-containing diguanylate cyclase [Nitrospirillum amazonense]ASG21046.1 GGDEF domain-containing protein [Nitrospirillum amazonense CBAmc]TWB32455.1 diguanylate cyclase (GGDEF)-like protein [Nitrospirillum amazonense]